MSVEQDQKIAEQEDKIWRLCDALEGMSAAFRFIRQHHGGLPGVALDRCESEARLVLEKEAPFR